ncbi:type II toxin-antitoxin system RelE/ParE family toxin [Caldalkalibacillus thermarum TA2.A1]|uniref:Type II toxin-antitoxin system RelE/ParE family toxin n=1 Tax=Caldalkalibacillus thermarum (strain TA2.A1) TaxID=986075 RepID=A0A8X8I9J0_CALTT|nr:type II toxin-antitoxin system RelE/ParE family toxin [Caldalkalibacillus thermarum TA2.A1]
MDNLACGRLSYRPKDHRILLFMWDGNNIVLLHPFRKTTQTTPQRETS